VKTQKRLIGALATILLTIFLLYGIGCRLIYQGVREYSREAQESYSGAPVPALIALISDESAPYEKRNSAIWALGQIGDKRALPALQALNTSEVQTSPYDSTSYIVQYSVEKAIKQLNGISGTRWMYRWLD
jgi:hypothetical protein